VIWAAVYGGVGKAGRIARIEPDSGRMKIWDLPIEYSHPYDATPDDDDRVWISSENYLTRFDPTSGRFTVYPLPERTDEPRITVTRDGAVWYPPREAGTHGYGGSASVLYPDKDAIRTLGAFYSESSAANRIAHYRGPFTRVTGSVKESRDEVQNPAAIVPGQETIGTPRRPGSAGAGDSSSQD
jgi:hypothetical protein